MKSKINSEVFGILKLTIACNGPDLVLFEKLLIEGLAVCDYPEAFRKDVLKLIDSFTHHPEKPTRVEELAALAHNFFLKANVGLSVAEVTDQHNEEQCYEVLYNYNGETYHMLVPIELHSDMFTEALSDKNPPLAFAQMVIERYGDIDKMPTMVIDTDTATATEIRDLVGKLNSLVKDAQNRGIIVGFDALQYNTIQSAQPTTHLTPIITKLI